MKFVSEGKIIEFDLPEGKTVADIVPGKPLVINQILVIPVTEPNADTSRFRCVFEGNQQIRKKVDEEWSEGNKLYLDQATGELTNTATGAPPIAIASRAASATARYSVVRFDIEKTNQPTTLLYPPTISVSRPDDPAHQANRLLLAITAPTGGDASPDSFVYRYSLSADMEDAIEVAVTTDALGGAHTVSGLTAGTAYYFQARSVLGDVQSEWGPATPKTLTTLAALNPPTIAVARSEEILSQHNQLVVTIAAPGDGYTPDSYEIHHAVDAQMTGATSPVAATAGSNIIEGLEANTTYYFQARSKDAANDRQSAWSTTSQAATRDVLNPPQNFRFEQPDVGKIVLRWDHPAVGAEQTNYNVQRAASAEFTGYYPAPDVDGSTTSLTLTELPNESTHYIRMRSEIHEVAGDTSTAVQASAYTATLTVVINDTINPPTNVAAATITESSMDLSWTAPTGGLPVTGYDISYATTADMTGATTVNLTGVATSHTLQDLSANTTYYIQVRSTTGGGKSDWTTKATVTTLDTLNVPSHLNVTDPADRLNMHTTVRVQFGAPADGHTPDSYQIRYAKDAAMTTPTVVSAAEPGSHTISDLDPSTEYHFQVRSKDTINVRDSAWYPDTPDRHTTQQELKVPTGVTVSPVSATAARVSWSAPATGAAPNHYYVQRSESSDMSNPVEVRVTHPTTSYEDTDLTPDTTYYYRVKSVKTVAGTSLIFYQSAWTEPPATGDTAQTINPPSLALALSADELSRHDRVVVTLAAPGSGHPPSSYHIQYSKNAAMTAATIVENKVVGENTITGLDPATTYYFQARSRDDNLSRNSTWASAASIATLDILNPPAFLNVTTPSDFRNRHSTVLVEFGAPATGYSPDSYEIRYAKDEAMTTPTVAQAAVAGSHTISDLDPSTEYHFQVRSKDATNIRSSAWYPATPRTSTTLQQLNAPTGVVVTPVSATAATVSWEAPTTGATPDYYYVQRSVNIDMSNAVQVLVIDRSTTYEYTDLAANTTYYYQVKSVIFVGGAPPAIRHQSAWTTPPATGTTAQTINPPSLTLALSADVLHKHDQVVVTLIAPAGGHTPDNYHVEYSKNADMSSATRMEDQAPGDITIADLDANTTYYFRARSRDTNLSRNSNWTTASSIATRQILNAPTGLTATQTDVGKIALSWSEPATGAVKTHYRVQYDVNNGYISPGIGETVSEALTVDSLTDNATYYIRVRSEIREGSTVVQASAYTTEITILINDAVDPPTTVTATATSTTAITVAWAAPTTSIGLTPTSYEIQYAETADMTGAETPTAAGAGTSFALTGLTHGTTYYIQVRGITTGGGRSAWQPPSTAEAATFPSIYPPTALSLVTAEQTLIELSWTAPTEGVPPTSYDIRWATSEDALPSATVANQATGVSYRITGLTANTTYYVQVRGRAASETGQWSATWNWTTPELPLATPTFTTHRPADLRDLDIELGIKVIKPATGHTPDAYHWRHAKDRDMTDTVTGPITVQLGRADYGGLARDTQHYMQVRSVDTTNIRKSDWAPTPSHPYKTTDILRPPQPGFTLVANIDALNRRQIRVSWAIPQSGRSTEPAYVNQTNFMVYWSVNGDMSVPPNNSDSKIGGEAYVLNPATQYLIQAPAPGLNANRKYYVQLESVIDTDQPRHYSARTAIKNVTTPA